MGSLRKRARGGSARALAGVLLLSALPACAPQPPREGGGAGQSRHWNEISSRPAWPAYPMQPAVETSLEELESQGVKILRVRVRGTQASRINSDGVTAESSLALARSTQEATGTGEWTKARPCGEIDFLLRRCLDASQVQILKSQLHSAAI